MPIVYRVEKPNSNQGLWYTTDGLLQPVVHQLGLACASLPMEPDSAYAEDGIAWYSGCDTISGLLNWFSPKELMLMDLHGFKLMEYNSEYVKDYAGHQIFSKGHLLSSKEFDVSRIITGG
jgi:hypothetical protein